MKSFLKNNISIIGYLLITVFLELYTNFIICGNIIIEKPWIFITLVLFITSVLYLIRKGIIRYYLASFIILVQGVINLFCIILYDMTGTLFDFGMFNLRNDGMSILENIPMNFNYFYVFMILLSGYFIFMRSLSKKETRKNSLSINVINYVLIFSLLLSNIIYIVSINDKKVDYSERLYENGNNYQKYGTTSNFVNELYKGLVFSETEYMSSSKIDSFIYKNVSTPTSYFGKLENNNLVTILVESLEWTSFIMDPEKYPNGLYDLTQDEINYLFPNLTSFYNNGVSLVNNYTREKTDISESESIIGSYPTGVYINYDYPNNTNPFTIANSLKNSDPNIKTSYFHNGFSTYYNRNTVIPSYGFDNYYGLSEMLEISDSYSSPTMIDHTKNGERNLDSEMIITCKDLMFPTDTRFSTYITSITMHGMYYERENLKKWYDKLDSIGALPKSEDDEMKNTFRNYVAATMEFDYALGLIIEDLTNKDLIDNTTIVIFGDHNTYYQGLSNYVKNIYGYESENYTELYRTPLIILDSKLEAQEITKFTTTYDLVPTLLDLFGIKYFTNLYYGNSIFSDEASILYSRAYDIFLTDKIFFSNLNNILYKDESVDESYLKEVEKKALNILEKISYINQIFYQNYFGVQVNLNKYISNVNNINN